MDKTGQKLTEVLLLFAAIVVYSFVCWLGEDKFFLVKFWTWLTILLLYIYFRLQKQIVLFAPINLFCLIYLTVPLTNFYYISTDFESALFLERITLYTDYISLFEMSSFYYFVGLASIMVGHCVIKTPVFKPFRFEKNNTINPYVVNMVIVFLLFLGLLNFGYNVLSLAGGNIVQYMANVALRKEEFEESGTALGYQFYYMGSYLLTYSYLRKAKRLDILFYIIIITGIIIKGSSGRIYGTLAYTLSFVAIFYFNRFLNTNDSNTRKYLLYLLPIPIFGVLFYFLRIVSGMIAGGTTNDSFDEIVSNFTNLLGFYAIDKGNTPNVAVFMKIIDAWKIDHGYIFGKSLYSGILNNLPSALRPEDVNASSIMVRDLWYSRVANGGALPTTAIGEMYMNFGPWGVFLGMFCVGAIIKIWYAFVIQSRNYWHYLALILIALMFIALYPKVDFTNFNPLDLVIVYMPLCMVWLLSNIFKTKEDSEG